MKTKELIRQLQEADPSGEIECFAGAEDIFFVSVEPYYWDGTPFVLVRDETNEYYNIIGAKQMTEGQKLVITSHSVKDALWNCETEEVLTFPIEYNGEDRGKEEMEAERLEIYQYMVAADKDNS